MLKLDPARQPHPADSHWMPLPRLQLRIPQGIVGRKIWKVGTPETVGNTKVPPQGSPGAGRDEGKVPDESSCVNPEVYTWYYFPHQ